MRTMMALLVAATLATPALAAGSAPAQVRVQLADLDLASASGQRALDRRLWVATVALCGAPAEFSSREAAAIANCRADAMKSASSQIDAAHGRRAMTVASSR